MTQTQGADPLDVLVVGAGPTGLMMAGQLAARGVRCRIIDKAPARSDHSRALVVHPRTLELLDAMGIAQELVAQGQPTPRIAGFVNDKQFLDADVSETHLRDTAYPFVLFVSQVETERALERYLGAQGLQVERPLELASFTQDAGGVTAELRRADGQQETARAAYIIGCDGAHSLVRKGAGLSFEGEAYPQDFVLADVDIDWALGHDLACITLSDDGVFTVLPMKGERAYRIIAARAAYADSDAGAPTLQELQAITDRRCPVPAQLSAPRWLARFRLHHRGVDRYRAGRAFVAGDAAHIHSPAGGQGMNTGIQDAANLAWKLALVLRCGAPEALLDSYHGERFPVGQALLRTTDRMFAAGTSRSRLLITLRNLLASTVAPRVLRSRRLRERGFRFIGQLNIAYPDSPIVAEELAGAPRLFRGGPGKGARAPDGPLGDGSLHRLLRGPSHHLLLFSAGVADAAGAALLRDEFVALAGRHRLPCEVSVVMNRQASSALSAGTGQPLPGIHADPQGALRERYGLEGPGLYLVRPDGYIAFRAPSLDKVGLGSYLEGLMGPSA